MPKKVALALAVLSLGALSGFGRGEAQGASADRAGPGQTGVSFLIRPGSGINVTRAVSVDGVSWFAAATNGTVHIYRWDGASWHQVGHVRGPLPASGGDSGLGRPARLTGRTPDFTVRAGGADTQWFEVIARIRGKWQAAKFDYGRGPTAAIDARGVYGHLVRAQANGCGCAAGPETYTWYRFNGRLFVPTTPPGRGPACSASALDGAGRITGGFSRDPVLKHLGEPFSVSRFACADGWAIATGTRQGKRELAIFEQQGNRWLEAEVGPAKGIARSLEVAIPNSLLSALGMRIHHHFGRPHANGPSVWPQRTVKEKQPTPATSPVRLVVKPETIYQESWWGCCGPASHRWFAVSLQPRHPDGRRSTIHVVIYRWRHHGWGRRGSVHIEFRPAHREGGLELTETPLTGSRPRGFQLQTFAWPGWTTEIGRVRGHWRVIPFQSGHSVVTAGEGVTSSGSPTSGKPRFVYVPGREALTAYRYRHGVFLPAWTRPFASCVPAALMKRPGVNAELTRSSCGYGYALAVGTAKGSHVTAAFSDLDGRGWRHQLTARTRRLSAAAGSIPSWVLKVLERRLRRR